MRSGVVIFPTDTSVALPELAREAEALGLGSLWVPEHTHIPTSRATPWPGGPELPDYYRRTLDPFVVLAAAAAVTTTIRLGFGICLVTQRDPIATAKAVATLDVVSGGRVDFGVGAGWNREELANHGTAFESRFGVLRERVEAMKAIWTQDEAEFHGRHVDFDPIWSWPKPVQQPHPPVVMGGNGPRTLERVVAYGDAWMPIGGRGQDVAGRIPELRRLAAEAGRGHIPVWVFGAPFDRAALEELAAQGVEGFLFSLPSAGADEVRPRLHEAAALADALG